MIGRHVRIFLPVRLRRGPDCNEAVAIGGRMGGNSDVFGVPNLEEAVVADIGAVAEAIAQFLADAAGHPAIEVLRSFGAPGKDTGPLFVVLSGSLQASVLFVIAVHI